jgi:hypothetical protein
MRGVIGLMALAAELGGCMPDYPPSEATTYEKGGHAYCTLGE